MSTLIYPHRILQNIYFCRHNKVQIEESNKISHTSGSANTMHAYLFGPVLVHQLSTKRDT